MESCGGAHLRLAFQAPLLIESKAQMNFFYQILVGALGSAVMTAILLPLLKWSISTWMDDRLKRQLQELVHTHDQELERLKSELTRQFDRAAKLHQREFEVLPKTWAKVARAFRAVHGFTSPVQQYPDIDSMSEAQLSEFLASTALREWEKAKINSATRRTQEYIDVIYWHKYAQANTYLVEAARSLDTNGIFIEDELKVLLNSLIDRAYAALIEDEMNKRCPPLTSRDRLTEASTWMRNEGGGSIDAAEAAIKKRLWSTQPNH